MESNNNSPMVLVKRKQKTGFEDSDEEESRISEKSEQVS